ncbi:MAG: histidine phosphatase family protein [Mariprofundus sp.]|nr:histidine phosphatase family protein [Mariprofundus sp.]
MKTLVLIRHAKSSWEDPDSSDYDRILNNRGQHDALVMGKRLAARLETAGIGLDGFACSSARRAVQTAELLAAALDFPLASMEWRRELYLASPRTMLEVIQATPDEFGSVALLAHNPGITELAEILTGEIFGNVPTCGVITFTLPVDHWGDAGIGAELVDFDYPRRLSGSNGQE